MMFVLLTFFIVGAIATPITKFTSETFGLFPFLQQVSDEARSEYGALAATKDSYDKRRSDMERDLNDWAERNNVKDSYAAFVRDQASTLAASNNAIQELLQKLPTTFQQLQTIEKNKDLSGRQVVDQSRAVVAGLGDGASATLQRITSTLESYKPKTNAPGNNGNNNYNNGGWNNNQNGFHGRGFHQ